MSNIIEINIEKDWQGDYRIKYDGRYITLYGYRKGVVDEVALIPFVEEKTKNASPEILTVTNDKIYIKIS